MMCFPIQLIFGFLVCYFAINVMIAAVLYFIYGVEHPLKRGEGEDIHVWVEDESAYVLVASVSALTACIIAVVEFFLLLGIFVYRRTIVRIESSDEVQPLLQKV